MEKFSASRASKLIHCHASGNLEVAIPNWIPPEEDPTADNAANRGTHMHTIMAAAAELPRKDMALLAQAMGYIAEVRHLRRFKALIETEIKADWLLSAPSTTADLVLYVGNELHILDLKTGVIPVSPVENEQLMHYAISYGHLAPQAKGATLHIVQPWAGVMESWYADVNRLAQFKVEAITAELQIRQGSVTFSPGDHCQFCPANPHGRGAKGRPYCPAMMKMLYPTVELDLDEILGE